MQQTEIETAFAELLENIMGIQPAQIDRDLRLEKLGLDSLSKPSFLLAITISRLKSGKNCPGPSKNVAM
jgi:hypothetical protein